MCLICVDFIKGKMTLNEAYRAVGELSLGEPSLHLEEVTSLLDEACERLLPEKKEPLT